LIRAPGYSTFTPCFFMLHCKKKSIGQAGKPATEYGAITESETVGNQIKF
jgi:hypothetical protein